MSLGLAVAIGAPLQAGLVATAVGGILGGLLGGSRLQVTGASTGLTVVTAELIVVHGWPATCAVTILAGLLQFGLGWLKVARAALAVSPAIVHGTLAGIGVTIALGQLHVVIGSEPHNTVLGNLRALPAELAAASPAALAVGALTVAVLICWPRLPGRAGRALRLLPAALASVAVATAVTVVAAPGLDRVDLPSWRAHVLPEAPDGPLLALCAAVLTVALVGALESLLSAVAVDRLARERPGGRAPHTDLDRELRGQGAVNAVSGLLGGLPVSGGAMRGSANVRAGARSRWSTVLHGVWVLLAAGLLASVLELIPLAALGALVAMVGVQMVNFAHIRNVHRHREFPVYAVTVAGVVLAGVLEGAALGIAVAVAVSLHRLTRTRISVSEAGGAHRVRVNGQLTFLAVPRLSRALGQLPPGSSVTVELDGSFMDHAAYETLHHWREEYGARGGRASVTGLGGPGHREPAAGHGCRPWLPWHNHRCVQGQAAEPARGAPPAAASGAQLAGGLRAFQRDTAPLVREELARLAREGQRPSQLFLTCADSRLVTSMITSSGPGDLFTVRNVGNFAPPPGADPADESVAAAIEYAVDVLEVTSITVCGHSGCGAVQALLDAPPDDSGTPLGRWLRYGRPSLERLRTGAVPELAGRPAICTAERLCITNVVQQLAHLSAHPSVARRVAEGSLTLHGMYFHVAEAQAYLLSDQGRSFIPVHPEVRPHQPGQKAESPSLQV
ncbi:SulP family inorganic anion transporter [Streptomyces zingiberis]|uniref:Bifunctional SulP family inorganic anion transporter/carbonic anhydrase n=1 Tax=Streptomyces zingiberis TaxID=2053010 RepID=A0ABX1BMW4_9ACTN|nr:SulP family inorganic anion transporter [Streptomyces zingiberis]NJP99069.1 bifunctional SulP family inorganic anion transporter/carbonic anhydrase [Streptomyces zingiberis]